jgi:hypothetical protein
MTKQIGTARVSYGTPQHGKESPTRASRDRCCAFEGCSTILSTYNTSSACWVHTEPSMRPPLSRA